MLAIIRSLRSFGSRPVRSISLAALREVVAPSSWLDLIASSISELTRKRRPACCSEVTTSSIATSPPQRWSM